MKNSHILKKPKYYPHEPDWGKNSYMPISMNNMLMKDDVSLTEILSWVFEQTDQFDAIIGDYLHRNNAMLDETDEKKAIEICLKMGINSKEILTKKMAEFPNKTLHIRHVNEFYERKDFDKRLNYFNGLYNNNTDFHNEINFLTHQFLERQSQVDGSIRQLGLCKNYLLEELVIFEMLAEEDFLINIYPGKQLRVFKNIVTGKLKNISTELEKVCLVEMRFKPLSVAGWIKRSIEDPKNK